MMDNIFKGSFKKEEVKEFLNSEVIQYLWWDLPEYDGNQIGFMAIDHINTKILKGE